MIIGQSTFPAQGLIRARDEVTLCTMHKNCVTEFSVQMPDSMVGEEDAYVRSDVQTRGYMVQPLTNESCSLIVATQVSVDGSRAKMWPHTLIFSPLLHLHPRTASSQVDVKEANSMSVLPQCFCLQVPSTMLALQVPFLV